ncbi:MAG: SH3 domain-containing protein [Chloroflexi bacterium]|nr:SH3 domain-containing protein [Chloroflexota bacterium]
MKRSLLTFFIVVGLVQTSCNLPGSTPPQSGMMTAAAMTVQAALQTPLASPTAGASATVAFTPTSFTALSISVGEVTNCRSGPSRDYERITQIQPGEQVQVIGFLPPDYWVINTQAGICWLPAEFATPTGNVEAVPTVTAPPTPNGDAPSAPSFSKNGWSYYCFGTGQTDVTFNWVDKSNNETGYRVYRNDDVVAELPANSTSYFENIKLQAGQSANYQIEAYNLSGSARTQVVTITC